jgi:hypothetical protein
MHFWVIYTLKIVCRYESVLPLYPYLAIRFVSSYE